MIENIASSARTEFWRSTALAALAADSDVLRYTGKVLVAVDLAKEYGFTHVDGKTPRPLTIADV